jgi:ankyrin repeat protein
MRVGTDKDAGGGNVNTKNCKGQTPLYMAMAFLGESGISDASTHPNDSVDARLARIAALLIDAGATVDDKDEVVEYWGETALFRAARMCRHECIKVLLTAGADVNVLSKNGDTIFHFYRKNAHLTMQLILESGLKNIDAVDSLEGNTALHAAVKRSVTGLSVALLLSANADPSIRNKEGLSPLHIACRFDRIKSIQRLLEHGVDVNIITGPTLKAVIVEKSPAQSNAKQASSGPAWDSSSLDWEQFHDVKRRLESALSLVENERDKSNSYETPLHFACRYSSGDAVCALLKSKRPPNTLAQNANGNIPLEVSFRLDAPTTRLLLEVMSRQSTDIQRLSLCNTGGRDFTNFEDNLTFIFSKFLKLQQLSIEDCDGLRSLPPSVSKLNSLNSIRLVSCNCLRSLPDEIGTMTQLQNIKIENCQALEFPPAKICEGSKSTQRIQTYLKESSGATPLRSVKVLFLGNGRSGKTSVLRMLAGMPLEAGDAGPESTRGVSGIFSSVAGFAVCIELCSH